MAAAISEIWIYPVKGMRGTALRESSVEPRGLQYDRRWMVIDADGRFLSQREQPTMATLEARIDQGALTLGYEGDWIEVPVGHEPIAATVWRDTVAAYECGSKVAGWLSDRLGQPCRLVEMKADSHRPVASGGEVSFADGYPLLLIGQSSLDDLNSRLFEPLPMNRFRPNVVVTGLVPFKEDDLQDFDLGSVGFTGIKRCARCLVTTTDQRTGQRLGPEPIARLSDYRLIDGKALFGVNLTPRTEGQIRIGDELRAPILA